MATINLRRLIAVLLINLLLGVGGVVVANAQDDTPTPTPAGTVTAAAATPTPTPIVTTTESSDALPTVTVFGLTLAQWLELVVSAVLVVLVAHYGGALIVRLLRRLTRRTETALDDALLSVIRPQVSWLVAAVGFQFATSRLAFTNETIDALLKNIYFVLYWFVIVATVWRTIDFLIQWYGEHLAPDADQALSQQVLILLQRLARIVLVIAGGIILLASFGIDVLAVSAALGLSGFAIALAAQDTISNIISGLVIMVDHPFSIGDRIDVPALDTWADVVEIGMRTTKAVTRDNRLVIIPNTSIVDANVTNYSLPDPTYRLQTDIGIGSGESIPDVVRILKEAVRGVDGVLPEKNVDVLFTEFGDSGNTFRVRWWVASYADKRRVTHQVCSAIQRAADREGIEMPNLTYTVDNRVVMRTEDGQALGPAAVGDPSG
jgi:small-conductance mechanosensitive channel